MKDPECHNCGHPFFGHEKYCPECGQKNKSKKITFKSFIKEVFNGFISFDGKFWTTLLPLLTKPGKVSRDFIDGKRARYSNPFQFYLTVSIVFFIILGLADRYQEFKELQEGRTVQTANIVDIQKQIEQTPDSILKKTTDEINNQLNNLNKINGVKIDSITPEQVKNQTGVNNNRGSAFNFDPGKNNTITKMNDFQKAHPEVPMDAALDSLKLKKSFWNRFLYTKAKKINAFATNTQEENKKFMQEIVSYASVSIFIFLPFFTLFLRFIYIRRKFTYVEHLIFVFHTQTVFFILLTLFYLLGLATGNENIAWIFTVLFIVYLLIAMKKFYKQGYIKTFFKFCILNLGYIVLGSIGFAILSAVAFAIH